MRLVSYAFRLPLLRTLRRPLLRLRVRYQLLRSKRLVIGAAGTRFQGWVSTDHDVLDITKESDWLRYLAPGRLDAILAESVWEHLTPADALPATVLCRQFLRRGGYLRIAVPDGWHPSRRYLDWVRPSGNGPGADDHKALYNKASLGVLLRAAGFERIAWLEWYDESGTLHQADWSVEDGMVHRSARFDERLFDGRRYSMLIADAYAS